MGRYKLRHKPVCLSLKILFRFFRTRFYPPFPEDIVYRTFSRRKAFRQGVGTPMGRVLRLFRAGRDTNPVLYRFADRRSTAFAGLIPTPQATSATDFLLALRNTVCSRMAYLCMIFPVANSFSMSALSSGTKLFIRLL
jgi:hypothetical protein